ncbi:MAG: IS110 family transposase [Proteobacteria bacterium]|nr:IS110 family transposase [Pseudomonadota bacterium]
MVTRRRKSSLQKSKLEKIWNTASDSIGCRVDNTIDFEARTLVESLEQIRGHIVQTEKRILRICEPFPEYQSLLSIPGFGPVISPMTLGAIGNPHRFRNSRQVLKLVGLDLSASRSGKSSSNAIASISKKGKSELRYALYQAAVIASSRNKLFAEYFTLKMEERSR